MLKIKRNNPVVNGHKFEFELVGGTLLHPDEWNGIAYTTKDKNGKDQETYNPVYRHEVDNINISTIDENSDLWYRALEIVGFDER